MLGGAILFSLEHSLYVFIIKPFDPYLVCVGGIQAFPFGALCHHDICQGFGLFGT